MAAAQPVGRTILSVDSTGTDRIVRPTLRGIIVPSANAAEAAVVEDLDVIAVDSLAQTIAFLSGELDIEPTPSRLDELFQELSHYEEDFADVRGQEMAKRAVTIAAAGSHNLLMVWSITPPASDCLAPFN
jgi:magnesium chelatase family protein